MESGPMTANEFPADTEDYGCIPMSGQGQLTIPKAARDALGLAKGDRVYLFGSASQKRAWLVITSREGHEIARFLTKGH
jgi:bifunctional DNA-binding transcriptional regulator/antitoxin component of YhaV-PrlF toxin-antitoxin module